jgi:AcrR family transcriptional regulator
VSGGEAAPAQPYAVAARELLRSRLLEAVAALLRERDWADVTMAQIAREAGVSRQTVYNEFGSRAVLAQAYVLWEADRFLATVDAAVRSHLDDPVRAVSAAFATFLAAAHDHPLVRALVTAGGAHELLPLITTQGQPLHDRATTALALSFTEHWPQVGRADAHLLADAVVRLAISHAAMPAGSSQMTARSLGRLLGPFVERAVGDGH